MPYLLRSSKRYLPVVLACSKFTHSGQYRYTPRQWSGYRGNGWNYVWSCTAACTLQHCSFSCTPVTKAHSAWRFPTYAATCLLSLVPCSLVANHVHTRDTKPCVAQASEPRTRQLFLTFCCTSIGLRYAMESKISDAIPTNHWTNLRVSI